MLPRPDIPALTGLRLLAAVSVVIAHSTMLAAMTEAQRRWIGATSGFGMTLFFVLSGFVIHYNYGSAIAHSWARAGDFLWARFSRLYPLFFVLLIVDLPLKALRKLLLGHGYWEFMAPIVKALPFHLTLTQSWLYLATSDTSSLIYSILPNMPLTWSVSTEFFFYLTFPAISVVLARFRLVGPIVGLAAAICCVWMAGVFVVHSHQAELDAWAVACFGPVAGFRGVWQDTFFRWVLYFSPYARLGEFLLGCVAAQLYLLLAKPSRIEGRCGAITLALALMSIPVLSYIMYVDGGTSIFRIFNMNQGLAVPTTIAVFCAARYETGLFARALSAPSLVVLGEASYSMYLWHLLVLHSARGVSPLTTAEPSPTNLLFWALLLAPVLAALFLVSILSYRTIEVPAKKWLRTLGARRRLLVLGLPILAAISISAWQSLPR